MDILESHYAHKFEAEIEFGEESMNASEDFLDSQYPLTIELACVLIFGDEYGSPPMFRHDLHLVPFVNPTIMEVHRRNNKCG